MRDTWIEISKSALEKNINNLSKLSSESKLVPVIKSFAYGHGDQLFIQLLQKLKIDFVCVNYMEEAHRARKFGFKGRVMVAGPSQAYEWQDAAKEKIEIFLRDQASFEAWSDMKSQIKPLVHIKFDTGMNRQGFLPEDAESIALKFKGSAQKVVGICSHFSNVEDVQKHTYADLQLNRFKESYKHFDKKIFKKMEKHIASSASSIILREARFDLMRVGISIYGIWPSSLTRLSAVQVLGKKYFDLYPVLNWKTRIVTMKSIPAGEYVGYGCSYRTVAPTKIAVLPVGYYEGYPRLAGLHSAHVLVRGTRCKVLGRICMNMMMVDVTHLNSVSIGEEVVLIGRQGTEIISADDLADWSQTIAYELLSRISPWIQRDIVE